MANLPETPTYTAGVYQLETTDSVLGGSGGISNTQAQQLGNRTAYLKQHMDTAEANIATNTADIASNTSAIATKAPLASPALTGVPTAPTATAGTDTTQIATTAFVTAAFTAANLAQYAPLASPALTGTPTAPTATAGTSTTQIATTAFVTAADSTLNTSLSGVIATKAPLASPALTGTPTAPTATAGTNTTQIATTAFVTAADAALSSTLTTNINTKWTKAGDTATGNHGINATAASGIGLIVQNTDPNSGWAAKVHGDITMQAAPSATVDQALIYFRKKDGTQQCAIGQDPSQVGGFRIYNSTGANVAVVDNGGNYIGANLEAGGTWTPTIIGETTAGTATYSVRDGRYAIVGNTVVATAHIQWTGHTGTGNMSISGLPFPSANLASLTFWSATIGFYGTVPANTLPCAILANNASQLTVYSLALGTGITGRMAIQSGNELVLSIQYRYR